MKFTGQFVGAKLDLQNYKERLEAYLIEQLHQGIKVWLQVVAGSGGRVPLWSGMARASLLEIAELVNGRLILSPLRSKSRITQGRSLGTATQLIDNGKVMVTIETNVKHYNLQEYQRAKKGGSPSAPWFSRAAGLAAYRESIQDVHLLKPFFKAIKIKAI